MEEFDKDMYTPLTAEEMTTELIEKFGNTHLRDAMRIISTRTVTEFDDQMVHEAMCILVAMYNKEVKIWKQKSVLNVE